MTKFEPIKGSFFNDFKSAVDTMCSNSTNLDYSSYSQPYVNEELSGYKKTDFGLNVIENIFMKKYYGRLRSYRMRQPVTKPQLERLKHRPWLASIDQYGTPELWYLILALNDCMTVTEFENFDFYYYVEIDKIMACVEEETDFIRKKSI